MYEDLANLLDWESRIRGLASEFGQRVGDRTPVAIYGPKFLTHLFSPQPRALEDELRNFGTQNARKFPDSWHDNWPGRDHERLYFLLEEYGSKYPELLAETERGRALHNIFSWAAGPIEVDIIVPKPSDLEQLDPRIRSISSLDSALIGRIGPTLQTTSIRDLTLPEAIKLSQDAIRALRNKIAPEAAVPKNDEGSQEPSTAPTQRKDSWIKA